MRANELRALEGRLEAFLGELTATLGRRDRRAWAGAYVRGLLLDGERKSAEPMAARLGQSCQGLQQFVNQSPWPAAALLEGLVKREARRGAPDYWIIDETSFPKAGEHSVGVARQYCGALGKLANCQVAVSLHRASEAAGQSRPLCWRLFLPEGWAEDQARCARAGVPAAQRRHREKPALALELLDQAVAWGAKPGVVLADEAYGIGFGWRQALRERSLAYQVRVPARTTAWTSAPRLAERTAATKGRPARHGPRPVGPEPQSLEQIARGLPLDAWQELTWRLGSQGPQRGRFAQAALWAAHGWRGGAQPARVQEGLLIEWPEDSPGPTRYWLAWSPGQPAAPVSPARAPLGAVVAEARARWRVEQDYRELKEELGLDHFEGRSWQGFHHHLALVSAAFAFLREEQAHRRRRRPAPGAKGAKKKPPAACPASP